MNFIDDSDGRYVRSTKYATSSWSSNLSSISMYEDPPEEEISLESFEMFAIERLKLLRKVEEMKVKFREEPDRLQKGVIKEDAEFTKKVGSGDVCSHYVLRMAYCSSKEKRDWFLEQETTLFNYRLMNLDDSERQRFMERNELTFNELSNEMKNRERQNLVGLSNVTDANFAVSKFYLIPFQQAVRLIASRSVYLKAGLAYVPFKKLEKIIVVRFRSNLSRSLAEAANHVASLNEDQRIKPLIVNIHNQYTGKDYSKDGAVDKLTPDRVDAAAETHMPLCMKYLQDTLKRDHKLKHWARLQYGLFLKAAGMALEDAIAFWESHFIKAADMDREKFGKEYAYGFRHMFGKEGARKNYTPFTCLKIILNSPAPSPGVAHGCPYKHLSDQSLRAVLSTSKITPTEADSVFKLAKEGHYQLACERYFDIKHPSKGTVDLKISENVASHPNAYFTASVNYHKAKNNTGDTNYSSQKAGGGVVMDSSASGGGKGNTETAASMEL